MKKTFSTPTRGLSIFSILVLILSLSLSGCKDDKDEALPTLEINNTLSVWPWKEEAKKSFSLPIKVGLFIQKAAGSPSIRPAEKETPK